MNKPGLILVADDDAAIRTVLNQALVRAGYQVKTASNATILGQWLLAGQGDLVISDVVMPDQNIFDLLPRIKEIRPDLPVIVMSAQNTFMTAIRASESGVYEYLPKPFDLNELLAIVARALTQPKGSALPHQSDASETLPIIGRSQAMQDIYRMLARMMLVDLTVMIMGETGTGKELVARALHDFGKRREGPFVAMNMAAIPQDQIETELFGYEKSAFVGAEQRVTGRFEQAETGTLFLDEIGDMPLTTQTRLLRVLQQGEYTTVGGREPIRTGVRIIAATNKDLNALIRQGLFREDLYYRLNVIPVRLPPLRERKEDIPDLVNHFLAQAEKEGLPPKRVSRGGMSLMVQHSWPGNVRELENFIRRLSALYTEDDISENIVRHELSEGSGFKTYHSADGFSQSAELSQLVEQYLQGYFNHFRDELPESGLYQRILAEVEYPLITAALRACRGNQMRAADLLGLNRNTLRKKINELKINVHETSKNDVGF